MTKIKFSTRIYIYLFLIVVVGIFVWIYNRDDVFTKEMVLIPSGEVKIGSDDIEKFLEAKKDFGIVLEQFLEDERPAHTVNLKEFYIDKYEVTNQEYKLFVDLTNHPFPPTWDKGKYPAGQDSHPVNNISWANASTYCKWAKKRLPSEEEWEKAARGTEGNRYPWGNEFDIKKANFENGATLPVGSMKEDRSVYGVFDMAGNVMEWTDSWYKPYPGSIKKSKEFGEINKIIKGWSGTDLQHYNLPYIFSRASQRHHYPPYQFGDDVGFRCAKDGK